MGKDLVGEGLFGNVNACCALTVKTEEMLEVWGHLWSLGIDEGLRLKGFKLKQETVGLERRNHCQAAASGEGLPCTLGETSAQIGEGS